MAIMDIAQTDVVTASAETDVTSIVAKMSDADIGTVVVTEDETPTGLVTDRKIALALEEMPDIADRSVEEIMTEDLITVTEDTGIFEVLQVLGDEAIRRVPIVDDQETLQGIVSLDDILVLLAAEFGNASDVIEKQVSKL